VVFWVCSQKRNTTSYLQCHLILRLSLFVPHCDLCITVCVLNGFMTFYCVDTMLIHLQYFPLFSNLCGYTGWSTRHAVHLFPDVSAYFCLIGFFAYFGIFPHNLRIFFPKEKTTAYFFQLWEFLQTKSDGKISQSIRNSKSFFCCSKLMCRHTNSNPIFDSVFFAPGTGI